LQADSSFYPLHLGLVGNDELNQEDELMRFFFTIILFIELAIVTGLHAQAYQADLGNGQYQNPIIHADYSDPDVVRVGDDFYMVSSSFNCAPGLPVLHSKDLVNWKLINHVIDKQVPPDHFNKPQHGNGVWAPAIRYHHGWYYVFYGDPDFGIYMCKTKDPAGDWEPPHLVQAAKGWIDPCPFWDDDGNAYLVHAFAGSRAGIKSIVVLHRMAPDASRLLDDGVLVFDGHKDHPTIEGTKMYKRNGYYYIFAPGGGVAAGWQTILRSRNVYGPYEDKIVLHQGDTGVNGPHQGAWVELENGENWFIHFQEKQPYGRIVHLQPAQWQDGWLMMGVDRDGDGIGEPVNTWNKPSVSASEVMVPQTTDEFNSIELGKQWQWQANPQPEWAYTTPMGFLRMNPVVRPAGQRNLWDAPNLLLQKLPAEEFTATAKVNFHHHFDSETTGLVVMGRDYAYLALEQQDSQLFIKQVVCLDAENGATEKTITKKPIAQKECQLSVHVMPGGKCQFAFSTDGEQFENIGELFQAREGKWIGAKVGLFAKRAVHENNGGYANYNWFRISK